MPEVAKKWSQKLYPDLEKFGGLPQALQPLLAKLHGELMAEGLDKPFIVYASVRRESRSSQVMIARNHRAFSTDFWDQGVQYGSGWAKSLEDVAAAIHGFLVHRLDAAALKASHSWVGVLEQAFVHECGATAFVEHAWQGYVTWLAKEPPQSAEHKLLPLIRACMTRKRLRLLMPFTSHNHLCFSRTTGFPYTDECPPAFPVGDGFRMHRVDACTGPVDGDAETIARALEDSLSPSCPPAYHGTAESLEA